MAESWFCLCHILFRWFSSEKIFNFLKSVILNLIQDLTFRRQDLDAEPNSA
jgi:hypothetical protein